MATLCLVPSYSSVSKWLPSVCCPATPMYLNGYLVSGAQLPLYLNGYPLSGAQLFLCIEMATLCLVASCPL